MENWDDARKRRYICSEMADALENVRAFSSESGSPRIAKGGHCPDAVSANPNSPTPAATLSPSTVKDDHDIYSWQCLCLQKSIISAAIAAAMKAAIGIPDTLPKSESGDSNSSPKKQKFHLDSFGGKGLKL
jgi:hypothetical protein